MTRLASFVVAFVFSICLGLCVEHAFASQDPHECSPGLGNACPTGCTDLSNAPNYGVCNVSASVATCQNGSNACAKPAVTCSGKGTNATFGTTCDCGAPNNAC